MKIIDNNRDIFSQHMRCDKLTTYAQNTYCKQGFLLI